MIISIAGEAGSGKTTIGKILAKELNYNFYSMGDLRGKIALERGLTIDELNKIGESEKWTDQIVDDYQIELGKKENNFVIDGRLSWYFIPNSKSLFFYIDPWIGAKRVLNNSRSDEKKVNSIEEMISYIEKRKQSDINRYQKHYNLNPYDYKNHNFLICTTNKTPEEIIQEIKNKLKQ